MTIDIRVHSPIGATGADVLFTMGDHGGAFVSLTLFMPTVAPDPIQHDETFFGDRTWRMTVPPGKHRVHFQVVAYAKKALNRTYRSFLTIDGQPAAEAAGSIPDNEVMDDGFASFDLVVSQPS